MCRSNGFHSLRIQSPCHRMIGVYNHLLSNVYRFHYHSQKVIGSLGIHIPNKIQLNLSKCVGQFLLLILERNNYKKQLAYSIYQNQTIQQQILRETKLSLCHLWWVQTHQPCYWNVNFGNSRITSWWILTITILPNQIPACTEQPDLHQTPLAARCIRPQPEHARHCFPPPEWPSV